MRENILIITIFILSGIIFSIAFIAGVNKTERAECLKWQAEAAQFEDYYLLEWQKAQCQARDVKIK